MIGKNAPVWPGATPAGSSQLHILAADLLTVVDELVLAVVVAKLFAELRCRVAGDQTLLNVTVLVTNRDSNASGSVNEVGGNCGVCLVADLIVDLADLADSIHIITLFGVGGYVCENNFSEIVVKLFL